MTTEGNRVVHLSESGDDAGHIPGEREERGDEGEVPGVALPKVFPDLWEPGEHVQEGRSQAERGEEVRWHLRGRGEEAERIRKQARQAAMDLLRREDLID